tara:strand:- start:2071 stop:2256 length:186 start_codon:yes stop_codon:yes gene_type:complete
MSRDVEKAKDIVNDIEPHLTDYILDLIQEKIHELNLDSDYRIEILTQVVKVKLLKQIKSNL